MSPPDRHSFQSLLLLAVVALLCVSATARPALLKASSVHSTATASDANGQCVRRVVQFVDLAGQFKIPSGTNFRNTTVGALSAITYDHDHDVYYLLCDNRADGQHRFYTVNIDVVAHTVSITNVTFLTRSSGAPFAGRDLDPEGVAYSDEATLFVSSEREPPALIEFGLGGQLIRYLNIPGRSFCPSLPPLL